MKPAPVSSAEWLRRAPAKEAPLATAPEGPDGTRLLLILAVLAALGGAAWYFKQRQAAKLPPGGGMELLSTVRIGPKANLVLVNVRGRALLLGVTESTVEQLGWLEDELAAAATPAIDEPPSRPSSDEDFAPSVEFRGGGGEYPGQAAGLARMRGRDAEGTRTPEPPTAEQRVSERYERAPERAVEPKAALSLLDKVEAQQRATRAPAASGPGPAFAQLLAQAKASLAQTPAAQPPQRHAPSDAALELAQQTEDVVEPRGARRTRPRTTPDNTTRGGRRA